MVGGEQVVDVPGNLHPRVDEHDQVVAGPLHVGHQVRGEHDAQLLLRHRLHQVLEELPARERVQTGDRLVFDDAGLLRRGLLVRLLVLPNDVAGVRESLEWIREALSPRVAVSLMAQYYATNKAATDERFILLSRRITEREWLRAVSALEELGMEEGWLQEYDGAAHYYRPDFDDRDRPFKDIRDFQTGPSANDSAPVENR